MDVFLGFVVVSFYKSTVPRGTRGSLPWCSINLHWVCTLEPLEVGNHNLELSDPFGRGAECPSKAGDKSSAIY